MIFVTTLVFLNSFVGVLLYARLLVLMQRFTRKDVPDLPDALDDLPTVSVCIPARNETHAMTQCLERVIASSYPKLEIIVLDDASSDNTSILIKSFAHAGVRFVEGSALPGGWLGKNHAQHELYKEASGDYILYLDVDTHIAPHTIDRLVALIRHENAAMLSVLPLREDLWRGSVLFATLRHFWSIMSHTRKHPAATSSAWLVKRTLIQDSYDGFNALQMAVAPERSIARTASASGTYRFFLGTRELGISYEKKWLSQCQTSIRLLYPFFGGKPMFAALGLLTLLLLLLPFVVLPSAIFITWSAYHTASLVASGILLVLYMTYTGRVWRNGWLIGSLLFPIILAQECVLLVMSMYAYATKTVTWKGRPIKQSARDTA